MSETHPLAMDLKTRYRTETPALAQRLGFANPMAVPRIQKIIVHCGVGRLRDERQQDIVRRALALITGQKPSARSAKQAIASFKTRRGLVVGYQVTLRGQRMWDFLNRLVAIAIPRQRDFRGIPVSSFDGRGNLTMGFPEHIVFPELIGEEVPLLFGLEVTIVTTARRRAEALELFRALGLPLA